MYRWRDCFGASRVVEFPTESVLHCRIVYFIHIYTQTKHWLVKDIKIFWGLRQYAKVHVPITRFVPSQIFHNTGNDTMFLIRFPKCVRTKRNKHWHEWTKFMLVWCLDDLPMFTQWPAWFWFIGCFFMQCGSAPLFVTNLCFAILGHRSVIKPQTRLWWSWTCWIWHRYT